ncbi:MAG: hypothetical protein OCD02_17025 [Spirochaetaceae bacterium]
MKKFRCDVRCHNRRQLELKTQFPIPDKKKATYGVDIFLFTPGQLNINKKNYGISGFLRDYQSNIRYSSPQISLASLVNDKCKPSPFNRINKKLDNLNSRAGIDEGYILYELRVLTNIYRLEMRSVSKLIVKEFVKANNLSIINKKIENHIKESYIFLEKLRSLYLDFMTPEISGKLKTALSWADECMSMEAEKSLLKIYDYTVKNDFMRESTTKLIKFIEYEISYRNDKGFITMSEKDQFPLGETISYRESILKKWSQGAMYMNLEKSRTKKKVGHLLSGVAASIAMTFTVAATFIADRFFPIYSTPWIMVAIIIYMFKDRIKDILKSIFFRFMPLFISDIISNLIDPATNQRVGKCKTMARFCTTSDLPYEVNFLRERKKNPFRSILPAENIINCKKSIIINCKKLLKNHTRHNCITEITRINLDNWLKNMDDNTETYSTLKNGKKIKIKGSRVYHLHLIVSLSRQLSHYRLVLNGLGLIKIEKISGF